LFFFNTTSWHYWLVNYVFGDSLFVEKKYDLDATIKIVENKAKNNQRTFLIKVANKSLVTWKGFQNKPLNMIK